MRRDFFLPALLLAFSVFPALANVSGRALHLGTGGTLVAPLPIATARNVTLEMWVRPSSDTAISQLLYVGNGRTNGYGFLMHNGVGGEPGSSVSAIFGSVSLSATSTSGSLRAGEWTHFALARGEKEWRLYRNGALVGRTAADAFTPTASLLIGPGFDGDVDEVRIWERERSQEEILSTLASPLAGGEPGLRAYYDMNEGQENVVHNRAGSSGSSLDATLSGAATFIESDLLLTKTMRPVVRIEKFPQHMQFVPRNRDGYGSIDAAGQIITPGFDSIAVDVRRDGKHFSYVSLPLEYSYGGAEFAINTHIRAELAEYTLRLIAIRGSDRILVAEGADIVAGDTYLIAGQSNSHWSDMAITTRNRYLRSFGVQTRNENFDPYLPADTMWGIANGHGFGGFASGPLLTGAWGVRLQEMIAENHGVPVCIINGGAGGSLIEMNLRSESPFDSSTVYGRTLYRAEKSGLRGAVRAIFWYQGESNTIDGYASNFRKLYNAWHQDYPGIEKVYVFQIRPGCVMGPHGALREYQRTLRDSFPDISVMSTAGLYGHDGCHYLIEGYRILGEQIYKLVARDLYGSKDTLGIAPPDLDRAFFPDSTRSRIALLFRPGANGVLWGDDTLIADTIRKMSGAFFLDGVAGQVVGGRSSGDTLFLMLRGPSSARTVSYLPDRPWYDNASTIYKGPWLYNRNGVGALAFHDQPIRGYTAITASVAVEPTSVTGADIMPNPASTFVTVRFDADRSKRVGISIIDQNGVVMLQRESSGVNQIELDLTELPSGVYLCRVGDMTKTFSIVR